MTHKELCKEVVDTDCLMIAISENNFKDEGHAVEFSLKEAASLQ